MKRASELLRTQLNPLSAQQTEAIIRLLIDAYYGEEQTSYSIADYVEMKGRLAEALDA